MAMDVAIIGLACRFPGDADNVENFWTFLCEKRTSVSEKTSRWNIDAFYSPKKKHNASITRRAHYLKQDIAAWDAKFFDISKAEAEAIDPQQRIFLEVVYEALENAGLPMHEIAGSRTGVFLGSFTNDYSELVHRDPEAAPSSIFTGTNNTSTSNRVSWFFDFKGPSFTLNTACSSSLVALHLACQSLQTGDSDTAIVGGVNLLLNPDIFMQLSNQGFLAHDGQCKSFDASGDGYGRGDGFAAIVIRRADDAIKALNPVRAVIRGTGCNQDGRTRGFTLPSADAQAALTEETYRKAGLDYSSTLFVEAHGTGTQAGDAEETFGLAQTIAANRSPLQPLLIGSVKSNIGHLEGCAGLAGLIKTILILERGVIPPTYGLKTLNPKIKWTEWNLEVPTEVTPWPSDGLRRISTQGFGYGGTNAHAILDDATSYLASKGIDRDSRSHRGAAEQDTDQLVVRLYVINAQDRAGLQRVGKALASHVRQLTKGASSNHDEEQRYLYDLAYTLAMRRSKLQWSTAVVASSSTDLSRKLNEIQSSSGSRRLNRPVRIGFVFTGQGAQWPRMGQELMAFSSYRESVRAADKYLCETHQCCWSAEQELAREEEYSLIHEAEYSQTLCTVLQVALVDLLASWEIRPSAVVGHSSGEIAAAYCAGALTREHAWKVAYFRGLHCGQLKKTNPGLRGAMVVASATSIDLSNAVPSTSRGEVFVACFNSPFSITYAGDEDAIDELLTSFQEQALNAQKLRVNHAYHSPHMQAITHDYMESLEDVEPLHGSSECTFFSSVHGEATKSTALGPAYWVRNLASPVRFTEAVKNMLNFPSIKHGENRNAIDILVEIGPHDAMRGAVIQIMQAHNIKGVRYITALERKTDCIFSTLTCAGTIFTMGVPVNLRALNRFNAGRIEPLIDLPAYPWNHSHSFWWESRLDKEFRSREHRQSTLLGAPQPSFGEDEWIWRGFLRANEEPWIQDHVIQGEVLYPAAGFLAMVIEAAVRRTDVTRGVKHVTLRDVVISAALIVPANVDPEIVVVLRPHFDGNSTISNNWLEFTISSSIDSEPLRKNCSGLVRTDYDQSQGLLAGESTKAHTATTVSPYSRLDESCKIRKTNEEFYSLLASLGLEYGKEFAKLDNIEHSPGHSVAKLNIAMPSPQHGFESRVRPHVIHPATLDASFQLAFATMLDKTSILKNAMVPTRIGELVLATTIPFEKDSSLFAYAHAFQKGHREAVVDIAVLDDQMTELQLEIKGMFLTEVPSMASRNTVEEQAERAPLCYNLPWRPVLQAASNEQVQNYIEEKFGALENVPAGEIDKSIAGVVTEYVYLLRHNSVKDSRLSVLEVDINCPDTAKPLLIPQSDRFKHLSRFCQYQVLLSDQNRLAWLKSTSDTINAYVADVLREDLSEIFNHQHDLIVLVNSAALPGTQVDHVLRNFVNLLSSEGRIILIDRSGESNVASAMKLQELVTEAKLSFLEDGKTEISLICAKRSQAVTMMPSEVIILEAKNPNSHAASIAEDVVKSLHDHGISTQRRRWSGSLSLVRGKACISLVELNEPFLERLSSSDFERLQIILLDAIDLTWVSTDDDPAGSLISGLVRTIHNEVANAQCRTLRLDKESISMAGSVICNFLRSTCKDVELRAVRGVLHSSRIEPDLAFNERVLTSAGDQAKHITTSTLRDLPTPAKLAFQISGIPDSICLEPDSTFKETLLPGQVEIDVRASGARSQNVTAAFSPSTAATIGFECAGVVRRVAPDVDEFKVGDSVATYSHGPHRTIHRATAARCELIPNGMSFESAATVLSTYGTAWYGITKIAKAEPGQSILIHAIPSGVAQSAIMLSQYLGLVIYVTVGSDEDRHHVRDNIGLPSSHIFNAWDISFVKGIMRATEGRGVDIIFYSFSGEALRESWNCLTALGTFLEISHRDTHHYPRLAMVPFRTDCLFASYNLSHIATERPQVMQEIVGNIFALLRQGAIEPVSPLHIFPLSQASSAFHMGRTENVVLAWSPDDLVPCIGFTKSARILDPDGVYVLVGGLGGIGRSLAMLLVELGARRLCFLSRSGAVTKPAQAFIANLQCLDVRAVAYPCDVGDTTKTQQTIQACQSSLGPIRGIIQCAMSLQDVLFTNMMHTQWVDSLRPKVQGTRNLHEALPSDLNFFIILSSFAGIFGNRGQANYAAACNYQDAFAHFRRAHGLKAVAIDLGIIQDVGVLAETEGDNKLRPWGEHFGIREMELHRLIRAIIEDDMDDDASGTTAAQIVTGFATAADFQCVGLEAPYYFSEPRFSLLAATTTEGNTSSNPSGAGPTSSNLIKASISSAESLEGAAEVVVDAIVDWLATKLQTSVTEIDQSRPVHSYGVDSLLAVEVTQWVFQRFQAAITVFELLAAVPITSLARKIAEKSADLPVALR